MNAHWTPMAASQAPIFTWWRARTDPRHAFRAEQPWRSLCDRLRWSVKLEQAGGEFCADCRQIGWSLTEAARDAVVTAESERVMRTEATSEAELVAGYGGLPTER